MLHLGWAGLVENVGRVCNDGVTLRVRQKGGKKEVDKSQVSSSIVNSLLPWGEPMYQGCFTFHLLTSQDAKPHLFGFLPVSCMSKKSDLLQPASPWKSQVPSSLCGQTCLLVPEVPLHHQRYVGSINRTWAGRCVFGEVKGQAENTSALLLGKAIESKVRQVHFLEVVCEGGLGGRGGEANQQPAVTRLAACHLPPPPPRPQRHENSLPPVVKNELGWSDSCVWDLNNLF